MSTMIPPLPVCICHDGFRTTCPEHGNPDYLDITYEIHLPNGKTLKSPADYPFNPKG